MNHVDEGESMKNTIRTSSLTKSVIICLFFGNFTLWNTTAKGQEALTNKIYLSIGINHILPANTKFADAEKPDSVLPLLYGSPERFTVGKITGTPFSFGVGYRFYNQLRGQIEFIPSQKLNFKGNANYSRSGEKQPSNAKINSEQLLLSGFYDFPDIEATKTLQLQPYIGLGIGYTKYRLKDFVQHFPDPDDPEGYLRRGPHGAVPLTQLPKGQGQELTYMFTTGLVMPLNENLKLDLSYRYTDAGETGTDIGDIIIVRYREDGTRREIPVKIEETVADFKMNWVLLTLRYEF